MKIRNAVTTIDYQNIKKVFLTAFPKEECPPFFLMKRKAQKRKGMLLLIEEEKQFLGFFYIIISKDLVYLAFFAMSEENRNHGYGSKALAQLKQRYEGKRILIACEKLDPSAKNYAIRVHRHNFYCRNGFIDLPCEIIEAKIHYDAMSTGPVQPEEYDRIINEWGSTWMTHFIGLQMVNTK